MLSITADTNIYVSALNFGGPPDRVVELARAGRIRLTISEAIRDEVSRVLGAKFGWKDEAIRAATERMADFTEQVYPTQTIHAIADDPSDNRILECAQTAHSDYIVTGDNHLLRLGLFGTIRIVKPAEFLQIEPPEAQR
ncbi:MAG: putative toxin-antitoxin system toxin component, PIN family [Acidobacteriaceae bacterium]